jgi:hypothetical protein
MHSDENIKASGIWVQGPIANVPNPDLIYSEVMRSLQAVQVAGEANALTIGSHNAAFGNKVKADLLMPVYREIVTRHHLLAWQEVDPQFLEIVATAGGHYTSHCTSPNSRGQAVGFTVHKRFDVLGTTTYSEIQNLNNLSDLRAALRLDLRDRTTGLELSAVVVHYKSNYGGVRATSPVRRQQSQLQAKAMRIEREFAICLGDYNHHLDFVRDADGLINDGFSLFPPHDRASTHASGDRIDGMFVKNVPANVKICCYQVRNFWRNNKIGRGLSDHGLLTWKFVVKAIA